MTYLTHEWSVQSWIISSQIVKIWKFLPHIPAVPSSDGKVQTFFSWLRFHGTCMISYFECTLRRPFRLTITENNFIYKYRYILIDNILWLSDLVDVSVLISYGKRLTHTAFLITWAKIIISAHTNCSSCNCKCVPPRVSFRLILTLRCITWQRFCCDHITVWFDIYPWNFCSVLLNLLESETSNNHSLQRLGFTEKKEKRWCHHENSK